MMKTRVISGIFIAIALIALIYCSQWAYVMNIAMAVLSAAAVYEVGHAIGKKGWKIFTPFCMAYAVGFQFIPSTSTKWQFSLIFALASVMFLIAIFGYAKEYKFENLCPVYGMTIVVSLCFATCWYLRNDKHFGLFYLIMVFLVAWGGDSGAYFAGRAFGKHKMAPHVSPKKTWEGFAGGILTSVIIALLVGYVANRTLEGVHVNYILFAIMGLMGGIFAVVGDLSASVVKRNYDIKDYAKLIPGHGGIMDRFDSVMFTAAAFYWVKIIADWIAEH